MGHRHRFQPGTPSFHCQSVGFGSGALGSSKPPNCAVHAALCGPHEAGIERTPALPSPYKGCTTGHGRGGHGGPPGLPQHRPHHRRRGQWVMGGGAALLPVQSCPCMSEGVCVSKRTRL
eukprot:scaffold642_cov232-Pinguiococcus_pyrenoidosus.AAC.3